jgi:hypothetical protein
MTEQLYDWAYQRHDFTLRDISSLHGSLESMTRYVTWMRPLFFAVQNAIRVELKRRYFFLQRCKDGGAKRIKRLRDQLPAPLMGRLAILIAQDQAAVLWSDRTTMAMTASIRSTLVVLHTLFADPLQRLSQPIGYIVPRDPHVVSTGDASDDGGGAHCTGLAFWFDIVWSPRVKRGRTLKSTDQGYVHINSLEFIVVLLQLAAVIVRLGTLSADQRAAFFPTGVPTQPVLLVLTDNTAAEAWANKVTSKSLQGQQLIGALATLLRSASIGLNARHIPGVENILADFISRPTHFALSHTARAEQIFQTHALARTWDFFQPSPGLLQSLSSLLFSGPTPDLPSLPETLGQFVPAGSTILCSPTI